MLPFSIISHTTVSVPQGQQAWTATTTTWTVPAGVTSISAVCVGAGSGRNIANTVVGGAGGDLRWRNNIAVTPGEVLNITAPVQTPAGTVAVSAKIVRASTSEVLLIAKGGNNTDTSSTVAGDIGGGNGGYSAGSRGGGGAGGYSGNGGIGSGGAGSAGTGGAGGGGTSFTSSSTLYGGSGGGVGILGEGTSGAAQTASNQSSASAAVGSGGSGGGPGVATSTTVSRGGLYGGGGGGTAACPGGAGAVRIIWGNGRAFPSTKTTDL